MGVFDAEEEKKVRKIQSLYSSDAPCPTGIFSGNPTPPHGTFVDDAPDDDGGVGGGRDEVLIIVGEDERGDGGGVRLVLDELDGHCQRELDSPNRPMTRPHEQEATRMADHDLGGGIGVSL